MLGVLCTVDFFIWSLSPYNYNSNANEFILNTNGDLNYANVHSPDGAVAHKLPVKIRLF